MTSGPEFYARAAALTLQAVALSRQGNDADAFATSDGAICDKLITCEGGNDKDKDACVDSWIQNTQVYEAYKCGDAYSKYLDCVEASSICSNGKLKNDS